MKYSVLLDESIMQKGVPATAGSKMLENFIAPFDAAVVSLLKEAEVEISGRLSIGEFGVDGLFSDVCPTLTDAVISFDNSDDDALLCNDFTGAVSSAAAIRGFYYIHPTYGSVSRYGLIPSVSSIDQIGVLCKDIKTGFEILKIINEKADEGFLKNHGPLSQMIFEKPSSAFSPSHETKQKVVSSKSFARADHDFDDTTSDLFPLSHVPQIMQILCCGEFANNISRYDGIKFGYRAKDYNGLDELYTKSRTEGFGENTKLAALIGAMVLSQDNYILYYDKAMRLRRLIKESFDFSKYDVITATKEEMPHFPALSRLCGFPSITTPKGTFIANTGNEGLLYEI